MQRFQDEASGSPGSLAVGKLPFPPPRVTPANLPGFAIYPGVGLGESDLSSGEGQDYGPS